MALINGIYVHVINEDVDRSVEASSHAVETGIDITDTVKPNPTELNISGKIVSYSGYSATKQPGASNYITAWINLVKRDFSAFERMSFERLNDELVAFEGGVNWVNTGEVVYLNENGVPIDAAGGVVFEVRFEVSMPQRGKVRIQNAYKEICAFNIINTSNTGYEVRDYSCDEPVGDAVISNTYNGESGRVCTEFTNMYETSANSPVPSIDRSAEWVLAQLTRIHETGALITYEGRNMLQNYQIRQFSSSHPNTITGGADFQMKLAQCRIAISAYDKTADTSEYVDDAIAQGSVQQIAQGDGEEVWYYVQLGDSIEELLAEYQGLTHNEIDGVSYPAYDWIMKMNPDAFSVAGDITSLRAYTNILLGTR